MKRIPDWFNENGIGQSKEEAEIKMLQKEVEILIANKKEKNLQSIIDDNIMNLNLMRLHEKSITSNNREAFKIINKVTLQSEETAIRDIIISVIYEANEVFEEILKTPSYLNKNILITAYRELEYKVSKETLENARKLFWKNEYFKEIAKEEFLEDYENNYKKYEIKENLEEF